MLFLFVTLIIPLLIIFFYFRVLYFEEIKTTTKILKGIAGIVISVGISIISAKIFVLVHCDYFTNSYAMLKGLGVAIVAIGFILINMLLFLFVNFVYNKLTFKYPYPARNKIIVLLIIILCSILSIALQFWVTGQLENTKQYNPFNF